MRAGPRRRPSSGAAGPGAAAKLAQVDYRHSGAAAMGDSQQRQDEGGGLYDRLLQRLERALASAEALGASGELALQGLTPAELELIQAYLAKDSRWLRGWQAAAEEVALLARHARRRAIPRCVAARRRRLVCALCGAPAHCSRELAVAPCACCGSQLFCMGNPR